MSEYIPLDAALSMMADRLGLDGEALIAYAADAPMVGGDITPSTAMGIDQREGAFLYAIVRALRPEWILEIGVSIGISSLHLLKALDANGNGELISYDIDEQVGAVVESDARARWSLRHEDALTASLPATDVVFEDSAHTLDFSLRLYHRLRELNPRILIVHDYYTSEIYEWFFVDKAFDEVFPDGFGVKIKDSFRGFGVWVNPNWVGLQKDVTVTTRSTAPAKVVPSKPRRASRTTGTKTKRAAKK